MSAAPLRVGHVQIERQDGTEFCGIATLVCSAGWKWNTLLWSAHLVPLPGRQIEAMVSLHPGSGSLPPSRDLDFKQISDAICGAVTKRILRAAPSR